MYLDKTYNIDMTFDMNFMNYLRDLSTKLTSFVNTVRCRCELS